ncbi:MAG: YIP1 family protein [Actinobacteria bacterium]|nr:YIP1 family protein [Actinomycetota bacterium]
MQAPRAVFVALRDDDRDAAASRSEPVLLIVLLAGMALALASAASKDYHGLDFAVWMFLAGSMTGIAAYWAFGAVLFGAARALGSQGSYRRARHVLAFACVPLALSLAVAPAGHRVFDALWYAFVVWAAALLVVGTRAVHGWAWPRALAAALVPVAVAVGLLQL